MNNLLPQGRYHRASRTECKQKGQRAPYEMQKGQREDKTYEQLAGTECKTDQPVQTIN